ncbi:hypothetical protein ACWDO0_16330 [Nocardia rhamnosiphila]
MSTTRRPGRPAQSAAEIGAALQRFQQNLGRGKSTMSMTAAAGPVKSPAAPRSVKPAAPRRPTREEELSRLQLCAHEAGHAVWAVLSGERITECFVKGGHGRVDIEGVSRYSAGIAWAGPYAELVYAHRGQPPEEAVTAALADLSAADRAEMGGRRPREVESAVRFAMPAIRELAARIFKYGSATHADVERALGVQPGRDIDTVRWAYKQRIDPLTIRPAIGGGAAA